MGIHLPNTDILEYIVTYQLFHVGQTVTWMTVFTHKVKFNVRQAEGLNMQ